MATRQIQTSPGAIGAWPLAVPKMGGPLAPCVHVASNSRPAVNTWALPLHTTFHKLRSIDSEGCGPETSTPSSAVTLRSIGAVQPKLGEARHENIQSSDGRERHPEEVYATAERRDS